MFSHLMIVLDEVFVIFESAWSSTMNADQNSDLIICFTWVLAKVKLLPSLDIQWCQVLFILLAAKKKLSLDVICERGRRRLARGGGGGGLTRIVVCSLGRRRHRCFWLSSGFALRLFGKLRRCRFFHFGLELLWRLSHSRTGSLAGVGFSTGFYFSRLYWFLVVVLVTVLSLG